MQEQAACIDERDELGEAWPTDLYTPIHSRKLTWKPKKGPIKTTVLLKGYYMGFHVSLGWGFPKIRGTFLGGPIKKDYSILGPLILGNYHLYTPIMGLC